MRKKAVQTYKSDKMTFQHPGTVSPGRTEVAPGIHQLFMCSTLGTVVMMQEYDELDPILMIDPLIANLTEEEVASGYDIVEEKSVVRLTDGTELRGKKVTSKHGDVALERYVICHRTGGSGIIVITQIGESPSQEDKDMLDLFMRSLRFAEKGGEAP